MSHLQGDPTTWDIKKLCIDIERELVKFTSQHVEMVRKDGGDKLADELIASVAALFAARAICMIHVWTSESLESVRERIFATIDDDVKLTIKLMLNNPTFIGTVKPKEPNG